MPLIIRDVLSCMWLLPMGSQESSRYDQWASGEKGLDWLFRSWLPGLGGLGRLDSSTVPSPPQAVINSGVQVNVEARDFEGKLGGGQGGCGRWGWVGGGRLGCRALTTSILQASPLSTQPSWPLTWLCTHLTYVPGC